jgi:hypothetical protein
MQSLQDREKWGWRPQGSSFLATTGLSDGAPLGQKTVGHFYMPTEWLETSPDLTAHERAVLKRKDGDSRR